MNIANEQHGPLLMIGSDDGAVRVWRGTFEDDADDTSSSSGLDSQQARRQQQPELLTAWHALSGLVPGAAGPGLVTNWRQSDGLLLASGDVGTIRIWDMEHEHRRQDIATDVSITCLSGLTAAPAVVAAGRADGGVTLYDIRMSGNGKAVVACKEHTEWVVDLFAPPHQRSAVPECIIATHEQRCSAVLLLQTRMPSEEKDWIRVWIRVRPLSVPCVWVDGLQGLRADLWIRRWRCQVLGYPHVLQQQRESQW
jgi:WD40 repeat protein